MKSLTGEDWNSIYRLSLFRGMTHESVGRLLHAAHVVTEPPGTILFMQGDPADRFYIVLDGWVKLVRETHEGTNMVVHVFTRGESFAEAAIFDYGMFPVTAEVVSGCRLLKVPAEKFLSAMREDVDLAFNMLAVMARHVRFLVRQFEQYRGMSAAQRLGSFLLQLIPNAEDNLTFNLPYDKSLLAARLGMKPETLSRALAQLRDVGLETKGDKLVIREARRFRDFVGADDDT